MRALTTYESRVSNEIIIARRGGKYSSLHLESKLAYQAEL